MDKNDCFAFLSRRARRHAHSILRVQTGEIRSATPLIDPDWLSTYINILFRHAAIADLQLIGRSGNVGVNLFEGLGGVSRWFCRPVQTEEEEKSPGKN